MMKRVLLAAAVTLLLQIPASLLMQFVMFPLKMIPSENKDVFSTLNFSTFTFSASVLLSNCFWHISLVREENHVENRLLDFWKRRKLSEWENGQSIFSSFSYKMQPLIWKLILFDWFFKFQGRWNNILKLGTSVTFLFCFHQNSGGSFIKTKLYLHKVKLKRFSW